MELKHYKVTTTPLVYFIYHTLPNKTACNNIHVILLHDNGDLFSLTQAQT